MIYCKGYGPGKYTVHELTKQQIAWMKRVYPLQAYKFY